MMPENFAVQFSHIQMCNATETVELVQHTRWLNPEGRHYTARERPNDIKHLLITRLSIPTHAQLQLQFKIY